MGRTGETTAAGIGLRTGRVCYVQGYIRRHLESSQKLPSEKELLFKKENHQLQKVNSKVSKTGADKQH